MVNILVSQKKMNRGDVAEIGSHLVNERRLGNLKIHLTEVSPQKDDDFREFFYHVRQGCSCTTPEWGTSFTASS
jgi:hypothetical protein